MQNEDLPFYLWIEWVNLYRNWLRWWEDMLDLFWYQKMKEEG